MSPARRTTVPVGSSSPRRGGGREPRRSRQPRSRVTPIMEAAIANDGKFPGVPKPFLVS
jgi:hypothetical protein